MIGARRFVLRRGAAYLAAAFVAAPKASVGFPDMPPTGGYPQAATSSPDSERRQSLAETFYKQRRDIERRQYRRYRAWNQQDGDLTVLASTSAAWRASVMHDRIVAEQSMSDTLQEKIDAIWQKPLDWVTANVAKWIRGDA